MFVGDTHSPEQPSDQTHTTGAPPHPGRLIWHDVPSARHWYEYRRVFAFFTHAFDVPGVWLYGHLVEMSVQEMGPS
jgi:hypothetical protein